MIHKVHSEKEIDDSNVSSVLNSSSTIVVMSVRMVVNLQNTMCTINKGLCNIKGTVRAGHI